jgi:hypothetical protein
MPPKSEDMKPGSEGFAGGFGVVVARGEHGGHGAKGTWTNAAAQSHRV